MAEENRIDKFALTGLARDIDSMKYLVQDVFEEYFVRFNPDDKKDHFAIIWEHNRNRARMAAISELLFSCTEELEKLGIDVYKKCGSDTE